MDIRVNTQTREPLYEAKSNTTYVVIIEDAKAET